MSLLLYFNAASPPSTAVRILCKKINKDIELKNVELSTGEHMLAEYIKMNPQHTVPTLDDNGTIVVDSHAILPYLVSKYAKDDSLYPKDLAKRSLIDSRLHFDSGVAFSILKNTYRAHLYDGQTEYLTPWQTQKILDSYELINVFLERSRWIAGDSLTVADISLVTTVLSLEAMLPVDDKKFPKIRQWLNAADALPSFEVNKTGVEQYTKAWKAISKH